MTDKGDENMLINKLNRLTALAVALAFAFLLPAASPVEAAEPGDILVYLDGCTLEGDIPPQITAGRLMLPYRVIAEALGASVAWNGDLRRVSMFFGEEYVYLYIDETTMEYGTYTGNPQGQYKTLTNETLTLDAPPIIRSGRTLVPLRAVSECFGLSVEWDGLHRTALLLSPDYEQAETGNLYEEISYKAADRMYADDESFILVYFNGKGAVSNIIMPVVRNAVAATQTKVYALDESAPENAELAADSSAGLLWIWEYIEGNLNLPVIFFVSGPGEVGAVERCTDYEDLTCLFMRFPVEQALAQYRTNGVVSRGDDAPSFTLTDLSGESCSLSDYEGRTVLLYFWSAKVSACRAAMIDLHRLAADNPELVVLLINSALSDTEDDIDVFVKDNNVRLNVLTDPIARTAGRYGARIPCTVVIDPEGLIAGVGQAMSYDEMQLLVDYADMRH